MNSRVLFPVFARFISRSHVREKIFSMNPGKKATINLGNEQPLAVEKDTEKLSKYVCGTNIFIEGGEDIKLKEDSEYPDWLWNIRPPPDSLEELNPNTKSYWNKVRKIREKEKKYLMSLQKTKTVHK